MWNIIFPWDRPLFAMQKMTSRASENGRSPGSSSFWRSFWSSSTRLRRRPGMRNMPRTSKISRNVSLMLWRRKILTTRLGVTDNWGKQIIFFVWSSWLMSGGFLSHGGTIIKFKPSILIGFPIINKYYKPSINGGGIPYGKLQRSSLWYQKDQKRHGFFRDMYEEGEATQNDGFSFFSRNRFSLFWG